MVYCKRGRGGGVVFGSWVDADARQALRGEREIPYGKRLTEQPRRQVVDQTAKAHVRVAAAAVARLALERSERQRAFRGADVALEHKRPPLERVAVEQADHRRRGTQPPAETPLDPGQQPDDVRFHQVRSLR